MLTLEERLEIETHADYNQACVVHQHACNAFRFEQQAFETAATDFRKNPSAENQRALERQMWVLQEAFNVKAHTLRLIRDIEAAL